MRPSSVYIFLRFVALFIFVPATFVQSFAQGKNEGIIYGQITGDDGKGLYQAKIQVNDTVNGKPQVLIAVSKKDGSYELRVPAESPVTITFSMLGYIHQSAHIIVKTSERHNLNVRLQIQPTQLSTVVINERLDRTLNVTHIDPKSAAVIPSVSGNVEALIKSQPGVSSNNELSSQYSVRGGNYDENLVYVNDIEIFRPFLVRAGQQEGLSFLNSDLISSITFSAGGFEAKYGDKMSSVLDIRYRQPTTFSSSVMLSLLGGSFHLEGASRNKKFTWLTGIRQ
ncbi:MAG: carboxypeptidase-like regulatory domain-containing protein, partial [Bacteroidota bacterium]|nr:carboxypeptidase-like regulatory domain-containing protein [Bacteroidota bacterium]